MFGSVHSSERVIENFGCERGLGLSTRWQWSVMVTGARSRNRAHDQPGNRTTSSSVQRIVRSVLHPVLSRLLRTRTYYTCSKYVSQYSVCSLALCFRLSYSSSNKRSSQSGNLIRFARVQVDGCGSGFGFGFKVGSATRCVNIHVTP